MALFDDLSALLEPLNYKVYDTDVPETPTLPYVVLWGGDAAPHPEESVASQIGGVRDRLGVTVAAGTPMGCRIAHTRVREVLQPDGFHLPVGDFILKLTDHQAVQVDRDETITGTNRHPAYCVDLFRVER